jgi:hypothetical protein
MAVTRKKTVGRKFTVETHPDRKKIERDILKGELSFRAISQQYGMSKDAVARYVKAALMPKTAAAAEKREGWQGDAVLDRIEGIFSKVTKMLTACEEYLADPANPEKIDLNPKSWEIDIVYRTVEADTDKMITRKESLQTLLDKIDGHGYQPWEVRFKHADPRKLFLEAARDLKGALELIAKIEGAIKDQAPAATVNQFIELQQVIIAAAGKNPELRQRITEGLKHAINSETTPDA